MIAGSADLLDWDLIMRVQITAKFGVCVALLALALVQPGTVRADGIITDITLSGAVGIDSSATFEKDAAFVLKLYPSTEAIDMQVDVSSAGTYTITETIANNSGWTWTDLKTFLLPPDTPGLSFGNASIISGSFKDLALDAGLIFIDGGVMASGEEMKISYEVIVPTGVASFTIRQYDLATPPVPTPSGAVALVGLFASLAGMVIVRRRR